MMGIFFPIHQLFLFEENFYESTIEFGYLIDNCVIMCARVSSIKQGEKMSVGALVWVFKVEIYGISSNKAVCVERR